MPGGPGGPGSPLLPGGPRMPGKPGVPSTMSTEHNNVQLTCYQRALLMPFFKFKIPRRLRRPFCSLAMT